RSGKTLWLGPPREAANTAVVKSGDLLFLLNDDAELIIARSNRTGFTPLKRYTVADSATWAQPAISGNRIFIKDTSSLASWTVEKWLDSEAAQRGAAVGAVAAGSGLPLRCVENTSSAACLTTTTPPSRPT